MDVSRLEAAQIRMPRPRHVGADGAQNERDDKRARE